MKPRRTFGIRSVKFDPDKGFFLNGKSLKIKGVCIHHDAGCLGAAVPEKVLERRLRLLMDLGVNAIRTSHNPPAPELLDLCDRLGLLVKDEAFDEFTPGKNKWITGWNNGLPGRFGYSEVFDQWSDNDIQDMISRDRNHPSIIMWSIGNEIDYANDPFSNPVLGKEYLPQNPPAEDMVKCARPLIDAVKKLDPSRPVTAALANVAMSDAVGLPRIARHRGVQLPGSSVTRRTTKSIPSESFSAAKIITLTPPGWRFAIMLTSPANFSGPASITSARPGAGPIGPPASGSSICADSKSPSPGSARACGPISPWFTSAPRPAAVKEPGA